MKVLKSQTTKTGNGGVHSISLCLALHSSIEYFIWTNTHTHTHLYKVHLFNCLVTQIANQPITWQQLNALRHLDVVRRLLKFKPSIRMGKKGDLSDFEHGMVVGARRAGLSISKTADLLGFSLTTISRVYPNIQWGSSCVDENALLMSEENVDWLEMIEATVTQITTRYNQGMQNTISERTTHRTLKQMGYSSRRPHRVLLLSAKNRKRRLQFAQAHQNWTIEDWKNVAWSDESWFLLQH